MSENVYAPPRASLEVDEATDRWFYVVSPRKLIVLYFSTLGLYVGYWFYRQWKAYRLRFGAEIWPIARGIFMVFFVHALFRQIDERLRERGAVLDWNHSRTATLLVVLLVANNVLDRVAQRVVGSATAYALSIAILLPIGWTLCDAQRSINAAELDPTGASNRRLTAANFAWIALGLLVWLLIGLDGLGLLEE